MNNSTTTKDVHHPFFYHPNFLPIFVPTSTFSIFISFINIITIYIMLRSKSLNGAGNYPIVSILLGSAVQAMVTIPTYTFKRLNEGHLHREGLRWLCDFYRVPYFTGEHVMKVSLFLVSCDRLVATIRPYRYKEVITKKRSALILACSWLLVVLVDLVPFLPLGKTGDEEGCTYVPTRVWGVSVIVLFSVVLFVMTTINYAIIWKTTAAMTLIDCQQRLSVSRLVDSANLLITRPVQIQNISGRRYTSKYSADIQNENLANASEKTSVQPWNSHTRLVRASRSGSDKCDMPSDVYRSEHCAPPLSGHQKKISRTRLSISSSVTQKISTVSTCSSMSLRLAFEMKSTRTAFSIFVVYIFCWGWLGVFYLVDNFCGRCVSKNESLLVERLVVKAVSFTSSIFLPLVYCWKTDTFRREIKRFACIRCFV